MIYVMGSSAHVTNEYFYPTNPRAISRYQSICIKYVQNVSTELLLNVTYGLYTNMTTVQGIV